MEVMLEPFKQALHQLALISLLLLGTPSVNKQIIISIIISKKLSTCDYVSLIAMFFLQGNNLSRFVALLESTYHLA